MQASLLNELKEFSAFQDLPDEHLQWLIDRAETLTLEAGDHLFKKGEPANHMYVVLSGALEIKVPQGNQFRHVSTIEKGGITGLLPYSRMKEAGGDGIALTSAKVLSLHKDYFSEMEKVSHPMVQALVSVMTSRTRDFTRSQQQNEKMMALGKLSAGLAHELNNPASAIVRSSDILKRHLHTTPETFKQMMSVRLAPEEVDMINHILFSKIENKEAVKLSMMERTNREDEIAEWLEDQGVDDGYEMAETFVSFGMTISDVEEIGEITKHQYVQPIFGWLNNVLTAERLVKDIEEASIRISELIQSVKTYTHMDKVGDKELSDIHTGINSTLIMLNHKLKEKKIQVVKNFQKDLPKIPLYVSEMNQVWTNLIDNAIDAMDQGGKLEISTHQEFQNVKIDVINNGSGISPDIISQIFDPFFTTKPVGKGTGLGLDIVKKIVDQHAGSIEVESNPGKTVFKLCFPAQETGK